MTAAEPIAVVRLLGSGTSLREAQAAAESLAHPHGMSCDVYSVTGFTELARDARELQRLGRLAPQAAPRMSHLARLLPGDAPVVAASDCVRTWPQSIAEYVDARYVTLGTDGFGRSDTQPRLRAFFEVGAAHIVQAALQALVREGHLAGRSLAGATTTLADLLGSEAPAARQRRGACRPPQPQNPGLASPARWW